MSQAETDLTPGQRALKELAFRQMAAVLETLSPLQGITADPSDRDAVQNASGGVGAAVEVLRECFRQEPKTPLQ